MWFKVDDNLALHPKTITAGNAAMGLWVRAGAWSASQLTDGFVPDSVISSLGGTKAHARRLVEAGFWDRENDGYRFHDWHGYQPTRETVQARRRAGAERLRRYRDRRKDDDE